MNSFNDIRSERPDALSLTQLNRLVKTALDEALPGTYWARAETREVRGEANSSPSRAARSGRVISRY